MEVLNKVKGWQTLIAAVLSVPLLILTLCTANNTLQAEFKPILIPDYDGGEIDVSEIIFTDPENGKVTLQFLIVNIGKGTALNASLRPVVTAEGRPIDSTVTNEVSIAVKADGKPIRIGFHF